MSANDPFYTAFRGHFTSLLQWEQLDAFWGVLRKNNAAEWYLYAIGEPVPALPSTSEQVNNFLTEIDALLHTEHREDYCGIVYADSKTEPMMIKIFDPNNLGVQCGFSDTPPLPGWVMSKIPPRTLQRNFLLPGNRRRWWQRLRDPSR